MLLGVIESSRRDPPPPQPPPLPLQNFRRLDEGRWDLRWDARFWSIRCLGACRPAAFAALVLPAWREMDARLKVVGSDRRVGAGAWAHSIRHELGRGQGRCKPPSDCAARKSQESHSPRPCLQAKGEIGSHFKKFNLLRRLSWPLVRGQAKGPHPGM